MFPINGSFSFDPLRSRDGGRKRDQVLVSSCLRIIPNQIIFRNLGFGGFSYSDRCCWKHEKGLDGRFTVKYFPLTSMVEKSNLTIQSTENDGQILIIACASSASLEFNQKDIDFGILSWCEHFPSL
jgi:hypothetical protein